MQPHSLSKLIKKEYLKGIIFPLVLIEAMLLGAYFWSNAHVNHATQNALISESKLHIQEISSRSASIINHEFKAISDITYIFQKEHERFFASYNPSLISTKDSFYMTTKEGVIYNAPKNEQSCSLFFSNAHANSSHRLEKAIATEALDSLYTTLLKSNQNIAQLYFNSYDSMNRLCPFMPDVLTQYAHDINIPSFNFYYLADKEHNPEKKVVWTDAYLDPAGLGWMISAIAPVYKGDFLEGVVGIDVTIDQLINNILSIKLPYTSMSMLIDEHGHILGMSESLEMHLGLKELTTHTYDAPIQTTISKPQDFNLYENQKTPFAKNLSRMLQNDIHLDEFTGKQGEFIITQESIPQTNWRFILVLDKASLLSNSTMLKEQTDLIGYIALGFMVVFYVIFLFILLARAEAFSSHILTPLNQLIEATKQFKEKLIPSQFKDSNIAEINILLENFHAMSKELQELYDSMDKKIKEGVIENMETQKMMIYQSRLAQMGEMISMIAHQWRQPLGSISAVTASIKLKQSLKKFNLDTPEGQEEQAAFIESSVTKIENYIQFLTTTIDDFRNFFRPDQHQDTTSLSLIIERSLKIIGKSLDVHKITLHTHNASTSELCTYETQVTQVVINILKNAQDALLEKKIENGTIWLNAYDANGFFIIEIEDNAGGIPEAILPKIFDPYFSTKAAKNGTGLGLYMSKTIIEEHCHGTLSVENTPKGAKFTIKICGETCVSQSE